MTKGDIYLTYWEEIFIYNIKHTTITKFIYLQDIRISDVDNATIKQGYVSMKMIQFLSDFFWEDFSNSGGRVYLIQYAIVSIML